ncbi:TetR/AcrR family transcriptional regulator [Nocardia sp. NBC_00416]|uniref:TetR/AcrR family transcriptional regulator n=1 Tax=Nocardia sp. NBC_00416 TaxID=2975991 RepID=UPI002E200502
MTRGSNPAGDRRVRRTRSALQRAVIELVEERDLSRIGVADVAERAGVSRSTFYDHYTDVHELAESACTSTIDDLIESLSGLMDDGQAEPECSTRPLEAFFTELAEHAGLYRSLLGPEGSARVIDHVRCRATAAVRGGMLRGVANEHVDVDSETSGAADVSAAFTAGALISVATDWLHGGCARSPAEMATLTGPLVAACGHGADPAGRQFTTTR